MRGKSLDQVDGVLREGAGRFTANHQHTDNIVPTQQRRHQSRAVTGAQGDLIQVRRGFLLQVGGLDRVALREGQCDIRFVKADVLTSQRGNQLLIHAIGGA